ncbi:DUF4870 domain-containing protein [Leptodesmis sp.]|uniref:DUF4870 domain-containing protein n=1 Tax=Leptodesmis sp. TaxID=3100501 RepID=UPI00405359A3
MIRALSWGNFFSSLIISIGIPIFLLLLTNDPIVRENAKESINFHINLYLYAIIFGILTLMVIGIPLLIILAIVSILMPIVAIVHCATVTDKPYRCPFIFRIV